MAKVKEVCYEELSKFVEVGYGKVFKHLGDYFLKNNSNIGATNLSTGEFRSFGGGDLVEYSSSLQVTLSNS